MRAKIIVLLVFSFGCIGSSNGYANERIVPAWLNEVKLGVLYHDSGDLWSRLRRESGVDLNLEAIFSPQFKILGGVIRPAFGGSLNTAGDTSRLYTGLRWQYEHASGMFFSLGLGGQSITANLIFRATTARLSDHEYCSTFQSKPDIASMPKMHYRYTSITFLTAILPMPMKAWTPWACVMATAFKLTASTVTSRQCRHYLFL